MRKSQVTIFIVLGLVILILFGFIFYITRQTSSVVMEKKINRIYGEFLSTTSIKEYISNCVEQSTWDAIRIASLQGGKIYDYQAAGGYEIIDENYALPFFYKGRLYNVSYGIKAPVVDGLRYLPVPQYPYNGKLVVDPYTNYSLYYRSVFARREADPSNPTSLTSLCNHHGPNVYNISQAWYTCETSTVTNISVQEYLKNYIIGSTARCINFPQFREQTRYNISEGKLDGFVLIGDDDLFVSLSYPLILSIAGAPPITRLLEFKSRPQVRLKKMHELAVHLIGYSGSGNIPKADANNIFFNITGEDPHDCFADNATPRQACILDGMKVSKISDYCLGNTYCDYLPLHYKYSDIINITDNKTIIDGEPLTFLFAVENRAPALDFADNMNVHFFDLIQFFALDPDEEMLNVSLSEPGFVEIWPGNVFRVPPVVWTGNVIVNVSDNEGLYDYQSVQISIS